ncbi:pyridoxamine 5'-phosphate oxidase family protein [Brevibacillus composti]|uniref:Pyridoxamine 5'-phosphate oxidase family protein n=1 Tax=Brevibacillus composti TaxID=2796470 RepID=A0A7T5JQT4_9BACL|nr:pyridoxamine 5'-phosphate oxidase family protein [Brevibacillus composti]QQE76515.1 pyridoxamine 5'-phosphate oxidase family protein [Brevibacillus composti]QUO43588.1 pyridoxamine 5'-phosphate oxidase family protein [Brevibacillus composti]
MTQEKQNVFREVVSTEAELREWMGESSEVVKRKVITHLDEHCMQYIAKAPFLIVATADRDGYCDASPRGDAPGFVHVIDEHHLVIPERPGNRRMDSMRNILTNPQIGLIFIIPGLEETLRINGRAFVIRDADILEKMAVQGKVPAIGIGVRVQECFVHCAKAFKRSGLWTPEKWLAKEELPSMAKALADHVKMPGMTEEEMARSLEEAYTKRLY